MSPHGCSILRIGLLQDLEYPVEGVIQIGVTAQVHRVPGVPVRPRSHAAIRIQNVGKPLLVLGPGFNVEHLKAWRAQKKRVDGQRPDRLPVAIHAQVIQLQTGAAITLQRARPAEVKRSFQAAVVVLAEPKELSASPLLDLGFVIGS
jgi:hypothetical protein